MIDPYTGSYLKYSLDNACQATIKIKGRKRMSQTDEARPPLPPFDLENAVQKVRMAEDAWNSRDPAKVSLAYTVDSVWRNRSEFLPV
jgi:hypothetical protein